MRDGTPFSNGATNRRIRSRRWERAPRSESGVLRRRGQPGEISYARRGAALAGSPPMRTSWLVGFLALAGCGADALDNTAYRRLVDAYDTNEQCLAEGNYATCYQTLTFCANGRAYANLDVREDGKYQLTDSQAIADFSYVTVVWDLETATSTQLPGKNPWELVTPLVYDCAE